MLKMTQGDYFNNVRTDIAPLLPGKLDKVLEIGCGTGSTLDWLKKEKGCSWACGVERASEAATRAKEKVELLIEGNIETIKLSLEEASFDLLLCLDVLEHLIDPWAVLKQLSFYVKPRGALIASIPNVRDINVLAPLILRGRWDYKDAGVLDRTHLRFFTKSTALNLVENSGFKVDQVLSTGLNSNTKKGTLNKLTLGLLKPFLETQFLIKGTKWQPDSEIIL